MGATIGRAVADSESRRKPNARFTGRPLEDGFTPMHTSAGGYVPQSRFLTVDQQINLEREGTAELTNDPRFFVENVIEKRLAAFQALAIITAIMAEESGKTLFELSKEFCWEGEQIVISLIELAGFFMMAGVFFMDLMACAVLSLQLFYTIRLFTIGQTGFDKASRFYSDRKIWVWRERAISFVKWGIVIFMLSTGFMMSAKFYKDGAPESVKEKFKNKSEAAIGNKILAVGTLLVFLDFAWHARRLALDHSETFIECATSVDMISTHRGDLTARLVQRDSSREYEAAGP
ncbi:unnamed protein product [Polarella glacialis]|uniref:Uncharacterized protein n=1 Tax=Polarella glacialis TaxID=89957 RepID=A0A813F0Z1_POLGL|nr:unnamed protein product [Polarella glacialis]|mmetsp:Transcript_48063/g.86460  ORF Transcript_48063/g.86460 Transcript_48063/m.86460 type:complete len:290 (-) Transcript_48063:133-1002(-)